MSNLESLTGQTSGLPVFELLSMLRESGFDRPGCEERVVIFSERIATLNFLDQQLTRALGLKKDQIETFHGTLDDQDQQRLVKSFGDQSTPVRILLASDAASEGINLHYFCHRMVHFDLPWSLITLEQRNGRIDRYGQTQTPEISYLLTTPNDPDIQGDLRVLERLIERENNAQKNLGDVAWLLNLHDAELEEEHIAKGIEQGDTPEEIFPDEPQHTDFMDLLFGDKKSPEASAETKEPTRLFQNDLEYAREAFQEILGEESSEHIEWHDHLEGFTLRAPQDLIRRFEYLPHELRKNGDAFKLTSNRKQVMDALEKSRQDESRWPEWQLFWELHPVSQWLNDAVLTSFSRHQAPVLRMPKGLSADERIFLFQGIISNRRSQPVLADWFGVRFRNGESSTIQLEELLGRTRLHEVISNPGGFLGVDVQAELSRLMLPAVQQAHRHMVGLRQSRAEGLGRPLREGLQKLSSWKNASLAQIEAKRMHLAERNLFHRQQRKRLTQQREEIEKLYEERKSWIDGGMRTSSEPYVRLAAVFLPLEGI